MYTLSILVFIWGLVSTIRNYKASKAINAKFSMFATGYMIDEWGTAVFICSIFVYIILFCLKFMP